jgi:hypothetical protein
MLLATNAHRCEAHLLSCAWVSRMLQQHLHASTGSPLHSSRARAAPMGEEGQDESGEGEGDDDAGPGAFPTKVIPVFVLPPAPADGAGANQQRPRSGESSSSDREAGRASRESKRREDDDEDNKGCAMSGFAVVHDAMLGHVALFRTSSGIASAVNLTVHTKLCELQDSLQVCVIFNKCTCFVVSGLSRLYFSKI